MSDVMRPLSFEYLLKSFLEEYAAVGALSDVPVYKNRLDIPIGPAAGPHTQLAENIVASWAAGAAVVELKTVQKLFGKDLQIPKPCICSGPAKTDAVYNIEWSSEFSPDVCLSEYIKAYLLIEVLNHEIFGTSVSSCHFIMSVGYDLAGIQSPAVDAFIEGMKNAEQTDEWQKDITWLKNNISLFKRLSLSDIEKISSVVTKTVTLSTMHGCKSFEIEKIASYLLQKKNLNVWIKMNPTLIGRTRVQQLLALQGYDFVESCQDVFESDLTVTEAAELLPRLQKVAKNEKSVFGVKMTNTLPVMIHNKELSGERMYLSGKPLFAISVEAALKIASISDGWIPMSFSGGITPLNIVEMLAAGFHSITVSSLLLQQGGYKNLTKLIKTVTGFTNWNIQNGKFMDIKQLERIVEQNEQPREKKIQKVLNKRKETGKIPDKEEQRLLCAVCHNCQDVCPNRANIRIKIKGQDVVVHRDRLCNECGNCMYYCGLGHVPYRDKFTLFENSDDFEKSCNDGVLISSKAVVYRKNDTVLPLPYKYSSLVEEIKNKWSIV